jgi:phosphoribosyl-AMP cyclohydrolase
VTAAVSAGTVGAATADRTAFLTNLIGLSKLWNDCGKNKLTLQPVPVSQHSLSKNPTRAKRYRTKPYRPAKRTLGATAGGGIMVELDFDKAGGLLPAIAQDWQTGEVLMLAYMNREAWRMTLESGRATYYSRSRRELWIKGNTSGHLQLVKEVRVDCDNDTILLKVEQVGEAACHTGHRSCFHKKIDPQGGVDIVGRPVFDPREVYEK